MSDSIKKYEELYDKKLEEKMISKGFGFKGPKLKAAANMGGFQRSIEVMIEMDDVQV